MTKHQSYQLSLLIPTYNDETTIQALVEDTIAELNKTGLQFQILLCNDASTDSTPKILESLKKKHPQVEYFSHTVNKGYGETIKDLYLKAEGSWLMSLPGDYQFEPSNIHLLLKHQQEADMIIGKRVDRHDTLRRRMQSKIYNGLLRLLFSIPTSDTNSIRLMKKHIIETIHFKTNTAFVDAELVILAHKQGYSIIEVPISHSFRKTGEGTGGKFLKTILPTFLEMTKYRLQRM